MMTNLFSIFDQTFLNLNWMSTLMGLLFIPMPFWFIPSRYSFFWNKINTILFKELKTLSINKSILLFISLFMFILTNNFIGMFPYIFTSTSHLTLTLSLALPLWFSFMLYGWINNMIHMFTHLIPKSTPLLLMPFMVLIETTSNLIRPGTLAIRLTANMITGHLLLTLLGNIIKNLPILPMNILLIIQTLLIILEMSIAIIQSYVFTILCIMYSKETH